MNKIVVDHEVVMEHTLSYFLSCENIVKSVGRDFDVTFLPFGHHLYTGLLQAAGYRCLKNKDKFIFVFEGENSNKISIYDGSIGPFLGVKRIFDKNINKIINKFDYVELNKTYIKDLDNHLGYLRILFETKQIVLLSVGKKMSKNKFIDFIGEFDTKLGYNLIFVGDIKLSEKKQILFFKDKKKGNIKFSNDLFNKNIVVKLFSAFVEKNLMKINILAKTYSDETLSNSDNFLLYLSALAK